MVEYTKEQKQAQLDMLEHLWLEPSLIWKSLITLYLLLGGILSWTIEAS